MLLVAEPSHSYEKNSLILQDFYTLVWYCLSNNLSLFVFY